MDVDTIQINLVKPVNAVKSKAGVLNGQIKTNNRVLDGLVLFGYFGWFYFG